MTSNIITRMKNDELLSLITTSIVRKVLTSFSGRMGMMGRIEYRRLRWIVCSRTALKKEEANQILRLLIAEGLIETTKPQANSEKTAWLTQKGREFLRENTLN